MNIISITHVNITQVKHKSHVMVNVICCCCWFWSVFDFSLWPFIFRIRIQCQTEKGWQKFNLGTSNLNGLGQSSRKKTKIRKIRMLSQDMRLQQFHNLFTFPPWRSDKRGNLKISLLSWKYFSIQIQQNLNHRNRSPRSKDIKERNFSWADLPNIFII